MLIFSQVIHLAIFFFHESCISSPEKQIWEAFRDVIWGGGDLHEVCPPYADWGLLKVENGVYILASSLLWISSDLSGGIWVPFELKLCAWFCLMVVFIWLFFPWKEGRKKRSKLEWWIYEFSSFKQMSPLRPFNLNQPNKQIDPHPPVCKYFILSIQKNIEFNI
jgi:hypothetical protein